MRDCVKRALVMLITAAVLTAGIDVTVFAKTVRDRKSPATGTQYIIAQDGSGNFCTIQEGVNNAEDGDTLIIYPGIYTENVEIMNKELNICGVDRDCCILQCDTLYYQKVPLTVAAGEISNLTILGINSGAVPQDPTAEEIARMNAELVGDSWERQRNFTGYAVHIDQNFLYQKEISFRNCRILSQNNHCVGIGSRGESSIRFENCELIAMGGGGCIYLHDTTLPEVSGTSELILRGCFLKSYLCPYVMTFHSMSTLNSIYLTFQNVHVSAVAYENPASYYGDNVSTAFDVRTLLQLERMGTLYQTGLSSCVAGSLVHEAEKEEACAYMEKMQNALKTGSIREAEATNLPEGITYIGLYGNETAKPDIKCQVIAVYNYDNCVGNGWCGLNNAYLTEDSYQNTLVEMNMPVDLPRVNESEKILTVQ